MREAAVQAEHRTPLIQVLPKGRSKVQWEGQLPSPAPIEHYEKILPGAVNRVIVMAEHLRSKRPGERGHYVNAASVTDFAAYESRTRTQALYHQKAKFSKFTTQHATNKKLNASGPQLTFAPYWTWLAVLGVAITAIGFVIGTLFPGQLTGILFPIGITLLLIVAHGARERGNTARPM